jgi:hypothetical protein
MIGPGLTWTMRPSTSKSISFLRRVSAFSWSSSRVRETCVAGGAWSSPTGGSWNDCAPSLPNANVSCQARFCLSAALALAGSTIAGGTNRVSTGGAGSWSFAVPFEAAAGFLITRITAAAARRLRMRVARTRMIAPYETWVMKSRPTGKAAIGTSQAPTLDSLWVL